MMATPFVFMSYNVHMWADEDGVDNSERVANLIRDHSVDIACLNEVQGGFTLQHVLSEFRSHYVHADYNFGNSCSVRVASTLRVEKAVDVSFERPENSVYWSEGRSAVRTSIFWPSQPQNEDSTDGVRFDVYCTHLDHRTEETRLEQLEALLNKVDFSTPHMICGDFNALCETDYSQEYLAQIAKVRARGRWEEPRFDVVKRMLSLRYIDALDRLRPDLKDREKSTCRFGTRIDYVWVSPSLAEKIDWARSSASLVGGKISDHQAIAIKFQPICLE
eukprot:TRINITY_DN14147_c0_g1_i1.p1 TRINITY_DN14147_c0_g1~~TRINITY_DN14147_c0_g1_i1.p1  ORF type:complete len:276 (-),score=17.55 TRINITY_DN14147_c0_g1_i1:546-1373(-)